MLCFGLRRTRPLLLPWVRGVYQRLLLLCGCGLSFRPRGPGAIGDHVPVVGIRVCSPDHGERVRLSASLEN